MPAAPPVCSPPTRPHSAARSCAPPPARCASAGSSTLRGCSPRERPGGACRPASATTACSAASISPRPWRRAARSRGPACWRRPMAGSSSSPMAERLPPGTASRLAAALDTGTVVGPRRPVRPDPARRGRGGRDRRRGPGRPPRLPDRSERPSGLAEADAHPPEPEPASGPAEPDPVGSLCALAEAFGVASLRGPILAARVARALAGEGPIGRAEITAAARLVLAPRATRLPAPEEPAPETARRRRRDAAARIRPRGGGRNRPPRTRPTTSCWRRCAPRSRRTSSISCWRVGTRLAAAKAGRVGQAAASRTGRPVGSRRGDPRRGRLDLLGTLRAAAPWQALRRGGGRRRAASWSGGTICGSGSCGSGPRPPRCSASMPRARPPWSGWPRPRARSSCCWPRPMSGATGWRWWRSAARGAELVLPPTRSLTRAKRGLSGLPGGGGTPLAAGIDAAVAVALGVRRSGSRPAIVLLTDGRANVARSGEGGRARAGAEALQAARRRAGRRAAGPGGRYRHPGRGGPGGRGRDGRPLSEAAARRGRSAQRGGAGGALSAARRLTRSQRWPPTPMIGEALVVGQPGVQHLADDGAEAPAAGGRGGDVLGRGGEEDHGLLRSRGTASCSCSAVGMPLAVAPQQSGLRSAVACGRRMGLFNVYEILPALHDSAAASSGGRAMLQCGMTRAC